MPALRQIRDGVGICRTIIPMQRKIFWLVFLILGLLSDFLLPIWWALAATIPIIVVAWWVAYRSDWF
jgi:hypothetical protein